MSRWSTDPGRARRPRRGPARALLVSLLVHALLLSLSFGSDGFGLPGLTLPWQARRAEVPDLRVVLATPRAEPPPAAEAPPTPDAPLTAPTARAETAAEAAETTEEAPPPTLAAPATAVAPAVIAVDKPAETRWSVPVALPASAPVIAAFEAASSPVAEVTRLRRARDAALDREAQGRATDLAQLDRANREAQQQAQQQTERIAAAQAEAERLDAMRLEAARLEAARKEATRVEAARAEAARLETERQEAQRQAAAKQEAQRAETARLDAERQETARRAAAQQEAARQQAAQAEAARAEAARQESVRQDAARAEAARQATARQEAARLEAARADAARLEATRQDAARAQAARLAEARAAEEQREARLRAIGQQLNEEAARRDAARQAQPDTRPSSWSSARRGRLFGRTDANAEMVLYAEAWARKIQLGQAFDGLRELVRQPHTDPLVTVAIRADGTVESVSFYRSSGVPAIDDAVRRVIESQANYPAFSPALAREYDVVEIRRTWHFDSAIRLY